MYGFAYEILDENHILVKPFWEEELVTVFGTEEQIEELGQALAEKKNGQEDTPVIVDYDDETMELEKGEEYEPLAG